MVKQSIQTGNPRGTYSSRDAHPVEEGLFFLGYTKGKKGQLLEEWLTLEHLERKKDINRKSREKHSDKIRVYQKQWRSDNSDKWRGYTASWRDKNRERHLGLDRSHAAKRRAAAKEGKAELTQLEQEAIIGTYLQCERLNKILGGQVFEVDHTVPLSKGGKHHPNNLQIVPRLWNRQKHNKHSERWEVPYGCDVN